MFQIIQRFFTFSITIDITAACNLRCTHCYLDDYDNKNDLTSKEWENRIIELKKQYPFLLHAVWMGGEPLLKKYLMIHLMKYFRYNTIFSNGSMNFSDIPKKTIIQISVDGLPETHNTIRGADQFEKIIKNIKKFPDLKYTVATTINKKNYRELRKFIDYFYTLSPSVR